MTSVGTFDELSIELLSCAVGFLEKSRHSESVPEIFKIACDAVRQVIPGACLTLWMLDAEKNRICRAHFDVPDGGAHHIPSSCLSTDSELAQFFARGLDQDEGWVKKEELPKGTFCASSQGIAYLRLQTTDGLRLLVTACVPSTVEHGDFRLHLQFYRLLGQSLVHAIERIRQHNERLLLSEISKFAVGEDSRRSFFDKVAYKVATAFDAHGCSIFIYDPFQDVLVLGGTTGLFQRESGIPIDETVSEVKYSKNEGLTGWVFAHKRPIRLYDANDKTELAGINPPCKPVFKSSESPPIEKRPFLGIPIRNAGSLVGVIRLHGRTVHSSFLPSDERRLLEVSDELGRAIGHWNSAIDARESLKQYNDLLKNLEQIIEPDSDVVASLKTIAAQAKQLFQACGASILLKTPGKDELSIEVDARNGTPLTNSVCIAFDRGLCGKSAAERVTIAVPDVSKHDVFCDLRDEAPGALDNVRSEACTPIVVGDTLLGVLNVDSDRVGWFHPEDRQKLQLLERLARQAAYVIWRDRQLTVRKDTALSAQALLHDFKDDLGSIVGLLSHLNSELEVDLAPRPAATMQRLIRLTRERCQHWKTLNSIPEFDHPNLQPFFLNELVESKKFLFDRANQSPVVTFKFDLDPHLSSTCSEPAQIQADAYQFHFILSNLISNAADALPDGGEITVRTKKNGRQAGLSISDSGIGIDPELLSKLFVDPVSTKGSSGKGLLIVKSIVHIHNATIDVESKPKQGSAFNIWFPLT